MTIRALLADDQAVEPARATRAMMKTDRAQPVVTAYESGLVAPGRNPP